MTTTAPYGTWPSPITAADLAGNERPVESGCFVGDQFWWSELVPAEQGRYAVRRRAAAEAGDGDLVLPAPWNARTRVHEYGGGAWCVSEDEALVFAEFSDQRLYRLDPGSDLPRPLTPEPVDPAALRYGELSLVRPGEVWCVRESHADGQVSRDLVAVPLDGSASQDPAAVRSIVGGSHFLAGARLSPDGRTLAWIAWEHPQLPWDGTELRVADLAADGRCGPYRTLLGGTTESVLQPEWISDDELCAVSDRSGWWNLYRLDLAGGSTALCPREADFAGPMWTLGARYYELLPDGRLATVRTVGTDTLGLLDPATGELTDVDLAGLTSVRLVGRQGSRLIVR
ncbi:MAG TPA: S9 family peptidase, partial [Candidatus Nanopelagicales bacterium]|nr:S9 family peptidase [Candidatus Nanopelagicales bacterium]